jgi:two-component system, chemotaxis family, sensor kinase CheA
MNDHYEQKLLNEFVAENSDHLESIEPDLLAMERSGAEVSKDILNRVFRAIHSIKGSSGFFNLSVIMNLSHVMENLLMCFRDGVLFPDPDKIDALLCGVDKLRLMLNDVQASDKVSITDELDRINGYLSGTKGEIKKDTAKDKSNANSRETSGKGTDFLEALHAFELEDAILNLDKETVKTTVAGGMYVYAISAPNLPVSDLESYGQILFHDLDKESLKSRMVYATAMETDLLCDFISLPKDRIILLEREKLLKVLDDKSLDLCKEKISPETDPKNQAVKDVQKDKETGSGETIRVGADIIDRLMNLVGELVLARNQLKRELESIYFHDPKVRIIAQNLNTVTSKIQGKIMQMRLQPIGGLFHKFPRLIRDHSHRLLKKVDLKLEGEEVELDKSIVKSLFEPLAHLLQNAVVHGIESEEERKSMGKPEVGQVVVKAFKEGGLITLIISDDGCGIDPEKIALISTSGFSSAPKTSTDTRHKVGTDQIKNSIEKLGGTLDIDSVIGHGTTVKIRLPLTMTIIPSIIVGVWNKRFAIPQVNVTEIVNIKAGESERRIEKVGRADVMRLRGKLLPLLKLSDALDHHRSFISSDGNKDVVTEENEKIKDRQEGGRHEINVIVMRIGNNRMGLVVDNIFDTEEIVVKPLSDHLKECKCYAGSTILGDGRVAMILDVTAIARICGFRLDEAGIEAKGWKMKEQSVKDVTSKPFIIFNNTHDDYFAVALEGVSKIEKVGLKKVYRSGDMFFMDYIGKALPLLSLEKLFYGATDLEEVSEYYVIIPKNAELQKGILVSQMPDAIHTDVEIKSYPSIPQCISGVAFIGHNLVRFLNLDETFRMSEEQRA